MLTISQLGAGVLPHIADSTPFSRQRRGTRLALLELVSELQRVYGVEISDDDVEKISNIADIAQYLSERMQ